MPQISRQAFLNEYLATCIVSHNNNSIKDYELVVHLLHSLGNNWFYLIRFLFGSY